MSRHIELVETTDDGDAIVRLTSAGVHAILDAVNRDFTDERRDPTLPEDLLSLKLAALTDVILVLGDWHDSEEFNINP